MRVVKEAQERRNEILDAAEELFNRKGFDQTSTGEILEKVGIARGTLYYHFKSKEDILDGLINRYHERILVHTKQIIGAKDIPIKERMVQAILAMNMTSVGGAEVINMINKPQNALMHQKLQSTELKEVIPILTELIDEGIQEGIFDTPYPYEAMETIMTYVSVIFDDNMEWSMEEKNMKIPAFIYNIERLLGARQGSLNECIMKIFEGNGVVKDEERK